MTHIAEPMGRTQAAWEAPLLFYDFSFYKNLGYMTS
jgi:hypothetical protein